MKPSHYSTEVWVLQIFFEWDVEGAGWWIPKKFAGIRAQRVQQDTSPRLMAAIDNGGDKAATKNFLDHARGPAHTCFLLAQAVVK